MARLYVLRTSREKHVLKKKKKGFENLIMVGIYWGVVNDRFRVRVYGFDGFLWW